MPDIAHRSTAGFNAGDVDGVLGCFTPDALYVDLFYGRFTGRAGLRRLFERMYADCEQHEWIMIQAAATPDCTIGEWRFSFMVSSAVPRSSGRRLSFDGVSVFETRGRAVMRIPGVLRPRCGVAGAGDLPGHHGPDRCRPALGPGERA